ncbi:hypothetical protein PZB74_17235 [Porifericola rhodea]|uniref:inositol monophosphatase family protein n=1 Tax=Porifericola rhodea TaxID=930972 RepID=UPI002666038A|nr:inositol monophosphatase family protein [Porifericola rhodea]WKN30703.1 hypothetical protein PZB74_17235 [Porifericola rhodea]
MDHQKVKDLLLSIGQAVCNHVYRSLHQNSIDSLSQVAYESAEDTIYHIDREVEHIILPMLNEMAEELGGIKLIAEGISTDEADFIIPASYPASDVKCCIIIDPIDGTRGIMYNKRSAFFLAAAAPNNGSNLFLEDLEVAVMTELPTSKAYLSDVLYAQKGEGAYGHQRNLLTDEISKLNIKPSTAQSIVGGFAQFSRFFPPGRDQLAKIEEELIVRLAGVQEGKALVFEDQYISSGGQLYELLVGHDRFTADLRPLLYQQLRKEGKTGGLSSHPYDLCTVLIAREAGLIITDEKGNALNAPLNLSHEVSWVAYANKNIQQEVEPLLQEILKKSNWI